MSSSGYDWEWLMWMLAYAGPTMLVWLVALAFCMARRRENPKGAMFLGLAILVQFLGTAFNLALPFLIQLYDGGGVGPVYSMPGFQYIQYGITVGANVTCWILVTIAVFARPTHYDFSSGPMFEDESLDS